MWSHFLVNPLSLTSPAGHYFLQSAKSKGDWDASKNKCNYKWEEGAIIEVQIGKKFLLGKIISKLQNGQFSL
jgi:hypothetical protein